MSGNEVDDQPNEIPPNELEDVIIENEASSDDSFEDAISSLPDDGKPKDGCEHYTCRCAYVSPCCKKVYVCRLCHDDKEQHELDRFKVTEIVCLKCDQRQPVGKNCTKCEVEFGRYYCEICRLYDDTDKKQFHCFQCGICRTGGRENYFHCPKCDMCLSISLKDRHKCIEKVSQCNCPVCMENLHTTREKLVVLSCGHICHNLCMRNLLKSGNYACPICCHSMYDMSDAWQNIDHEIQEVQMPDEYKDVTKWILCRDCHKECETKFHIFGLKCLHCGSYNTCEADRPVVPGDGQVVSGDGQAVPEDGQAVPRDGQVVPRDGQAVPRDGQAVLEDRPAVPQNGSAVPEDGREGGVGE